MLINKKKKAIPVIEYNPKEHKAVLKCSICNGEQVAGFKDIKTGRFIEVMLITGDADLEAFMNMYKLDSITKEY